jgi:hypothetical protein
MTITTRDLLIDGLANNSERLLINKASLANAAAGQFFSLWAAGGTPGAGAAPTTAAVCTSALTGALSFTNQTAPVTSYIGWLAIMNQTNSGSNLDIHDRIAHMGGLSGTVTTAQGALDLNALAPAAARLGAADYSDVQWWLEIYTALGATGVNATVAVTYDDASTGNLAAVALGATPRAGRLYPLLPAVAGRSIRAVTGVTLSATTGTAGNFGITATRQRTSVSMPLLNKTETFDWAQLGLPIVPNDSCLVMVVPCITTTTGAYVGCGKLAHG